MSKLNTKTAREIIYRVCAQHTHFSFEEIRDDLTLDDLGLDDTSKLVIHKDIVQFVEHSGYRTAFSVEDIRDATTVGDMIPPLVQGTDSGGPKYRP